MTTDTKTAAKEERSTGVYMRLLHGRLDPDEHMNGWGFDGPVLGPFAAVHFTYINQIRCIMHGTEEDIEFEVHDDLLVYDGKYYGDFEIVSDPAD